MTENNKSCVDLNADVGESYGRWQLGDDQAMVEVVTSVNVACGFHAGDPTTLGNTCQAAVNTGTVIGAQVSYPDLMGFGRRFLDISPRDLRDAVTYQIGGLAALARFQGGRVRYVKPHGALYHAVTEHQGQADALVEAVAGLDESLPLVHYGGAISDAARKKGLRMVAEGFADRGYTHNGVLISRDKPGALLTDPEAIAQQAVMLAQGGKVESICVHGDTPGAVEAAYAVRRALNSAQINLRSFLTA